MKIPFYINQISTILATAISGKKILALGGKAVGKTTLQLFLREGHITRDVNATGVETLKSGAYNFYDGGKKVKKYFKTIEDISGSEDFREFWKKPFLSSDVCFYIFNAYEVYRRKKETIYLLNNHLHLLNRWREINDVRIPIIVIGSFADKIPSQKLDEEKIKSIIKPALQKGKIESYHVFIGSLKNTKSAKMMMDKILRIITQSGL